MIGTINIKVSAAHPNMPLGPFHVFAGSAASVTIVDIPLPLGVRKVTGVTLSAKNVAGVTTGYSAVRVGSAWGVTVPPSHFAASGFVERGVSILATGIDDNGDAVTPWKLGAGDLFVMEPDGSVAPGETVHDMHWHDVRPEHPVGGDVAPYEGGIYYFNGEAWVRLSTAGDVSHSDFSDVEELTAADSVGQVKETVNMLVRKLKGSAAVALAVIVLPFVAWCDLGPSTIHDDIPGTATLREIVEASGASGGGDVQSVNGKTGVVELVAADVGALPDSYVPPPAPVQSVNGKTGAVQLNAGDVGAVPSGESSSSFTLRPSSHFMGGSSTAFSNSGISHGPIPEREFDIGDVGYLAWDWLKFSGIGLGSWIYSNYVPTTRKVNGQPLTQDISIEGMSGNALVLTNGAVKTKSGTAVAPSDLGAASVAEMNETKAIVQTWEGFLDGSNVVFSITNYISGAYQLGAAKLRILEMREGEYCEVYNSRDEILLHLGSFETNTVNPAIDGLRSDVEAAIAGKADKAWGRYTSAGGVAPSNTVYMTEPQTVFAGGMEYERVAVGEGAVCVLSTRGAPVYTQGDEGTFKFQDCGGTNYFGFAKTDSYTIGCNTDGIRVDSGVVTLTYNITMSGVPCVWYKADLASTEPWEQLNTPDGQPIPGASHVVQWDDSPDAGTEVCYLNCPEPKGFFKATVEVAGSAKFMTNMPADFSGGVLCTDGITVIYPHADGTWSSVK